jgi:hypothetical protein
LLTEQQIAKSWRKLFSAREFNADVADKAEALLEELRPESPLRHRFTRELAEVRKLRLQKAR